MALRLFALVASLAAQLSAAILYAKLGGDEVEAVPEDLISDLWDGIDIRNEADRRQLDRAPRVKVGRRKQAKRKQFKSHDSPKKLAILGAFDTGSHVLVDSLRQNYHNLVHEACDWDNLNVDNDRFSHCRVWKHGVNLADTWHREGGEPVYEVLKRQGVEPADAVVLLLVRSPLATIMAWKKAAYELAPCMRRGIDEFNQSCSCDRMEWSGDGTTRSYSWTEFNSTMDAYNRYMELYGALQSEAKLHAAVLVTYEDLVYSPGDVLEEIAAAMNWPQHEEVSIVDAPAKQHGAAHGRERALEKLRNRDWLGKINDEEKRKILCRGLNLNVLQSISDNRYNANEPSKSYAFDCEGYS